VTIILIASCFRPEVQGYYYTFASLLALQVFVELGLSQVIIQFASHEWSRLNLNEKGQIVGSAEALSRLVSLGQVTLRWYTVAGAIVSIGLGLGGYVFFLRSPDTNVSWAGPWILLCALTGIRLFLLPVFSLLEGCNQVAAVYGFRLVEAVLRSVIIWISISIGTNLWAASISGAAGLLCAGVFLQRRYWQFLKTLFLCYSTGPRINWRTEILPVQWRIALSWLSGYLAFNLFTPILFHYHGAVIAGRMGMTWNLVTVQLSIASIFVLPKAPYFGMLIAQRRYVELDTLFWHLTKIVMVPSCLGAFAIWVFVYILYAHNLPLAGRVLSPLPTGLFLLATVIISLSFPMSTYLRAHKKEPLVFLSVVMGISVALSTFILGRFYSATGMAIGYLSINVLTLPFVMLIWRRCRDAWHYGHNEKKNISDF